VLAAARPADVDPFRGSLGVEICGREPFDEYVRSVRTAIDNYRCEILECFTDRDWIVQ